MLVPSCGYCVVCCRCHDSNRAQPRWRRVREEVFSVSSGLPRAMFVTDPARAAAKGVTLCVRILLIEWSACARGCRSCRPRCATCRRAGGRSRSRVPSGETDAAACRPGSGSPRTPRSCTSQTSSSPVHRYSSASLPPCSTAFVATSFTASTTSSAWSSWQPACQQGLLDLGPHLVQLPRAEMQRQVRRAEHVRRRGRLLGQHLARRPVARVGPRPPSDQQLLVVAPGPLDDPLVQRQLGEEAGQGDRELGSAPRSSRRRARSRSCRRTRRTG